MSIKEEMINLSPISTLSKRNTERPFEKVSPNR
jgi:hypothetical protein